VVTELEVAAVAFELLTHLLTDPAYGLARDAPPAAAGSPDAVRPQPAASLQGLAPGERRLLRLLQRLAPGACARHARLVQIAAAAQPRLAEQLLVALPYDMEPKPDVRWLACAAAVGWLVRGAAAAPCALAERLLRGGAGAAPGADSAVVRAALRRCLPQAAPKVGAVPGMGGHLMTFLIFLAASITSATSLRPARAHTSHNVACSNRATRCHP
jgi:hypothetical protein